MPIRHSWPYKARCSSASATRSGMLALAVPRRVVGEQRRVLDELANRMRAADEETLLDVAGALLYVEASLDDHIERLGSER